MKKICCICMAFSILGLWGCTKEDPDDPNPGISVKEESLVVVNSGNFTKSNSSITLWNPEMGSQQEVFASVNGFKLGDVAQSATVHGDLLWIVVNNSNVVFAVDKTTFKEVGRIDKDILSPRYIHFVSDDKAYVTQMYSDRIAIVNPKTYSVTGYITVRGNAFNGGASEEMVQIGDYVYVNLWSYGESIVKIDTKTDEWVEEYIVGIQPNSLVKDYNGNMWTLCDGGGWTENPIGYEAPTLIEMDMNPGVIGSTWEKRRTFELPLGASVSKLCSNGVGTRLYFTLNQYNEEGKNIGGVYMMDLTEQYPQFKIVVPAGDRYLYSMTVSPISEEIFVADALDYEQNGVVYYYRSDGNLIGKFDAGIIPTAYTWITKVIK
ncbi:MAG: glutaminyl-peptide cyclotransferase [Muribaculaceae bacterium]|nr:glutaminyl-peptide cyclotransferase [Muribaculaceae bacterium]